ncbi:hypothetical protein GCM10017779_31130 [Streptomyces capillispiralis]|nr:hypothetical protein GCM10017779_31130 [Streptomyces capillispiralis]
MPGILRRRRTTLAGDRVGAVIRLGIVIAEAFTGRAYRQIHPGWFGTHPSISLASVSVRAER